MFQNKRSIVNVIHGIGNVYCSCCDYINSSQLKMLASLLSFMTFIGYEAWLKIDALTVKTPKIGVLLTLVNPMRSHFT